MAFVRTSALALLVPLLLAGGVAAPVHAAEEIVKREAYGQWAFRQTIVDGKDRMCSLVNLATDESALVMVASATYTPGIVLRIVPLEFDLPAGDQIAVTISVDDRNWPLGVSRPSASRILEIPTANVATVGLLPAIASGTRMVVRFGVGRSFEVDLAGADKGQDAFNECVQNFLPGD